MTLRLGEKRIYELIKTQMSIMVIYLSCSVFLMTDNPIGLYQTNEMFDRFNSFVQQLMKS